MMPAAAATYRAAVMPGPHAEIEIRHLRRPVPAVGEVIVRTLYSEVCGTDVHLAQGQLADVPYPIIPGHFSIGIVDQAHGQVSTVIGDPVREGDLVTFLDVHHTCHRCWHCLVAKTPTRCPSRKVYGVTHSAAEGPLGGWSEIVLLRADVAIAHLPKGLSPLRFIAGGCAMPTAIHALQRGELRLGDTVVIQGAGPVGLCAAVAARQAGAKVIITEMAPIRLAAASALNFPVLDLSAGDVPIGQRLLAINGGHLADLVIEATGVPSAIPEGIAMTRDGGCYVVVGHYTNAGETRLNPHLDINQKHLQIKGTWGIEYSHLHHAIQLLAGLSARADEPPFEQIITSTFTLDGVAAALQAVRQRQVVKAVIALPAALEPT